MCNGAVCYRYISTFAYRSKCPAQLRLTKGVKSVVLEKKILTMHRCTAMMMQRASSGSRKSL